MEIPRIGLQACIVSKHLYDSDTNVSGKNCDDGEPKHGSSIHSARHHVLGIPQTLKTKTYRSLGGEAVTAGRHVKRRRCG